MIRYLITKWLQLTDLTLSVDTEHRKKLRGKIMRPLFKRCGPNLKICKGAYFSAPDNISLGTNVYIGIYNYIGVGDIKIGDNVLFGPFVSISANEHLYSYDSDNFRELNDMRPIVICANSFIAAHSVITAGSVVGESSLVAAGAVVTRSFPRKSILAGVPAKVVGSVDNPLRFFMGKNENTSVK